jgi:hypothetical protein
LATDLSLYEVSGNNNASRRYSVTAWNAFIAALEAAYDLKPDSSTLSASSGSSLVGFIDSGASAVARTVLAKLREAPLSPEDFGAVGDGTTDDYAAFVALAAAINANGGGAVRLARGATYYIGQYRTAANGVASIDFDSLSGLVIHGNGAKIDFKGDFDRDVSTTTGIGFRFDDITGLKISDLEVDGNVEQTTNSSDSNENNWAIGIRIGACTGVVLENVYSHHFANDGIMVGVDADTEASAGVLRASREVTLINVRSEYNSRQALTVKEVENMTVIGGSFSYSAKHTGTYGAGGGIGHAPKSGMDFEPTTTLTGDAGLDIDPNNIAFYGSRFIDNLGGIWKASNEVGTSNIRFIGCVAKDPSDGTATAPILLGIPGVVIRDCDIDLGRGRLELEGGLGAATHLLEGNTIRANCSAANGILADDASERCIIRNNRFICTATSAIAQVMVKLNDPAVIFEDNYTFIPKEGYGDEGATDGDVAITVSGAKRAARNTWETDLLAASGSGGAGHFYGVYGTTEAVDEQFIGTATGTADTFRPVVSSAFNTNGRYSANRHGPSIQTIASAATVTPTFSDDQVNVTAQAAALSLANPTGTAREGWGIVIRIKDNGTARGISYGTQYRAIGVTLPTTTVLGKTHYLGMVYNSADTKWDVVSVAQEA